MNEQRTLEDAPCPGPTPEQHVPLTWREVAVMVAIGLAVLLLSILLIALAYLVAIEKIQR